MAVDVGDVSSTQPARDRVYQWVRDEIIKGTLPAGRFLDEVWVSELVARDGGDWQSLPSRSGS